MLRAMLSQRTLRGQTDRQFVYSPDSKDVGAWGGVRARSNKKEKEGLFPVLIKRLGEMLLRRARATSLFNLSWLSG